MRQARTLRRQVEMREHRQWCDKQYISRPGRLFLWKNRHVTVPVKA